MNSQTSLLGDKWPHLQRPDHAITHHRNSLASDPIQEAWTPNMLTVPSATEGDTTNMIIIIINISNIVRPTLPNTKATTHIWLFNVS